MRVLHLFSNYKWTGPAEPAVNLAAALRDLGVQTAFACGRAPAGVHNMVMERAAAQKLAPIQAFRLSKHRNPLWNWRDSAALRAFLHREPFDLVHCHLDNDHRIGLRAAHTAGVPVVRSSYHGTGFPVSQSYGRLLSHTAFVIEPSEAARKADQERFGLAPERTCVVPGAVDTARFDPARAVPDGRKALGIPENAFVAGVVARMQLHRQYEILWEAVSELVREFPAFHVVVVGRGTNQAIVGWEPVKAAGLADHVHFPGYISGDDYVGMLKSFDVKLFLVPGSDGTCRAVREAMAMSKPAIVARRGMLPEIVRDGVDGLVFDGTAQGLTTALRSLITSPERCAEYGRAARQQAETRYSLHAQAASVSAVYDRILAQTPSV